MVQDIKSILVGISGGEEKPSSALRYGLSLAQQASAHASIYAPTPEMLVTHAFVSNVAAGLVAAENRRLHEASLMALEQAQQGARASGVPCSVEVLQKPYSDLAAALAARSRVHDVTVLDAERDFLSLGRGILEEVLFNGGRPLLIVPQGTDVFRVERVLVAWDGSAKASRAVHDALPFLKAAQQVEIASVVGEKDLSSSLPGAELAPHLSRHGVDCTLKELPLQRGDAGETLRSQLGIFRADLLVMGSFVHSRWRQLVLGGVTQTMLKGCPVPLLLSY
ncbi:universal stress protein [Microvirga subterranea]|uniref:Nucleotide-binding universal stress UspA family protein n=1 Tax=Microvirga subterranea TaxID=186651 RepID=A0A370HTV1_9HYPH|nr:universal stress protein [Microvirga subterranea]RDI61765.1 nucleotide-binding universal stress UspA family protein [Microvirga subterranea]